MRFDQLKKAIFHRPPVLALVLGAMLLVSVLPLGLYHRQVLNLSQEKLTDTESVSSIEVARSMGEEIQLFDSNLYQQLISGTPDSCADRPARQRGRPRARPPGYPAA